MEDFRRSIVVYKDYFWDFYNAQTKKVQLKLDYSIGLLKTLKVVPKTYFNHITGSNGLWEIRCQSGNNVYRVFCCFDNGNLVILLSGFQKKTQKTPEKELDRAERIRKEYFDEKEQK